MKDFIKKISANNIVQKILAYILHFYIYFVYKTSKIIIKGNVKEAAEYVALKKSIVLFTWHGRILVAAMGLKDTMKKPIENGTKLAVISSFHRDGKIAAKIMKTFGINIIEGSTIDPKKGSSKNKKSLTSIRQTLKALKEGTIVILAPDGPRGPAQKMNTKITNLVEKTDTAIVGVSLSAKYKIQLKTWDNFQIFFPFNKIIIEYGTIFEPKNFNDIDELNNLMEAELNRNIEKNDNELKNNSIK